MQLSAFDAFASSQASAACTKPSPQRGSVQTAVQPSVFAALPSSQASPDWTTPSPQRLTAPATCVQLAAHTVQELAP